MLQALQAGATTLSVTDAHGESLAGNGCRSTRFRAKSLVNSALLGSSRFHSDEPTRRHLTKHYFCVETFLKTRRVRYF
jgi:hypothetical protein